MGGRVSPEHEFARVGLERLRPVFLAGVQVYLEGNRPLPLQAFDVAGIEVRPARKPGEFPPEQIHVGVVGNDGAHAVDGHLVNHGFTPLVLSQSRMPVAAPLSVMREGWGRWNTLLSPNSRINTREPSRSSTLAPRETSRLSMSAQGMFPETGFLSGVIRV